MIILLMKRIKILFEKISNIKKRGKFMLKIPYQGKEYSLKEILEENNISETVYRRHYINTGNRIQDIINA